MKRRSLLVQSGSIVLALGLPQLARGATIVSVRIWPAPDYSRVTIESDTALTARQNFVINPPRLAVDIEGLVLNPTLKELVAKVQSDDPNIAGIRVGQYSPTVVRLVVDLKKPIRPQVFTLKPVGAYAHRLVFDLYPEQEEDPLQALISEKIRQGTASAAPPAAPAQAASSEPADPLGEWMARQLPNPAPAKPERAAPRPAQSAGSVTDRLIIVALDPGHGGEDPGAMGPGGTREKDVVLRLAHLLR
ncbi:MAG: N-acetylmuramoyl-L-alanine amidase, partial [Rhodoferax sp.]|nr:N-acetylmuramoyl-L-alanine amidase [Rhodoferax sp.]